jgi:deoxyribodipyrimidine photo-lyase
MPPKRKASTPVNGAPPAKRRSASPVFDHSRPTERANIVQRTFYPPEISNERCAQYNTGEIANPFQILESKIKETASARKALPSGKAVVHLYKRDLRIQDNRSLRLASEKAKAKGLSLICLYVVSPQDFTAHVTSAARVGFIYRTLEILKEDLAELSIPLIVKTIAKRRAIPDYIISLCNELDARHVYCTIEYEVDELRRETTLIDKCLESKISFEPVHDDVVVPPGALKTGQGRQFSVYSPWRRAWVDHVAKHPDLLKLSESPHPNTSTARKTYAKYFDQALPPIPDGHQLTPEERDHLSSLWPAGEHEAMDRLSKFLQEKITKYPDTRNFPALNSTAMLSVHFASGTLSARAAVRHAQDLNTSKRLDGGKPGIAGWVSEIAWRDFYKHVLCAWPYVCMNKSFKYEYTGIEWEYNDEHFEKWCQGQTGYPIVDAAMRQLNEQAYMHNRCRMIVASFLAKDLLLDWRMGERYFMTKLIDGDFASNNGGWGFSASTGVDPQPCKSSSIRFDQLATNK